MKTWWRVCQRYNEARFRRASKAAIMFKVRSEKFYQRIKGSAK